MTGERKKTGTGTAALVGFLLLTTATFSEADEFDQLQSIDPQELAAQRGRDSNSRVTVQNNQTLSAIISDTAFTAGEINSGSVQLESGALNNFSGVGLFNFVTGNGNAIDVRTQEFDLLLTLARHNGIVLSRDQLLDLAWGYDYYGNTRTVDVHIGHLRKKLQDSSVEIETFTGVGYKLVVK